jgi:hypothetical protein
MAHCMKVYLHIFLGFLLLCSPSSGQVRETIEFMSSFDSRVAGYPGCAAAADFIEDRFRELGLGNVQREEFQVVVPVDRGGSLEVGGETFPLHGLWPNLARTSTLPSEGLRGMMIYGGHGEFGEFNGLQMEGRIVLMEFNSEGNWLHAASLGARAVIFVEPEGSSWKQAREKWSDAPLDLPRFWVDGETGARLRRLLEERGEVEVALWSRMDWEDLPAWNVLAKVPGSDPELSGETIAVEAYYDGISVVPSLAPSAETACSIAALLELAAHLRAHPPGRTVLLVATSAHFQARQGVVDFLENHARRHQFYAARVKEPFAIDLFVNLDLSSRTDELGVWNNTDSFKLKRHFVDLGRRVTGYAAEVAPGLGRDAERALVNGISPIRGMDWASYVPGGIDSDGEVALDAGIPALAFATVHDARFVVDTPLDDVEGVNIGNLERQVALLNGVLERAFDDPEFLDGVEEARKALKDQLRDMRVKVRTFPRRSQVPDRPVVGGVVLVGGMLGERKGVRRMRYGLTGETGMATFRGLPMRTYPVSAFALDQEDGRIGYAPDLSLRASKFHGGPRKNGFLNRNVRWKTNDKTVVVFPTIGRPLYGLIDPRFLNPLSGFKVIDAKGVEPRQYGYALGRQAVGVLFGSVDTEEESRLKVMMGGGSGGHRVLLLNSEGTATEDVARGRGFLLAEEGLGQTGLQAVRDMWALDEARMRTMRHHAIENQRLVRLHQRTKELIEASERAAEELQWDRYVAYVRAALGVESRAYPEVLSTLNDVIKGMVFFLALLIPAAFFGERLLFAAADIRRQLLGFGLLLLLIWLGVSQVHPAFEIAHPLVVLLAFAIMALAIFVLLMVTSRFNRHMKMHRNRLARVHDKDISRLSASYAAFMLGISNMRRRKMRTGLTLTTLVLLTFTLLSFTSFRQQIRFVAFPLERAGEYEGLLIRDRGWEDLGQPTLDYARSHFEVGATVGARSWYVSEKPEEKNYIEVRRGERIVRALGLLGVTPQERTITGFDRSLLTGRFFVREDENSCLIPERMAEELGIGREEVGKAEIQIFGRKLLVCGIVDAQMLEEMNDLDGENLMPADFQISAFQDFGQDRELMLEEEEVFTELKPFVHLAPENVVILPYDLLQEAGGTLRSVAVRFDARVDGPELIEAFLVRVATTLFAGLRNPGSQEIGVYAYSSMGLTAIEGLGALMIPALIAALIVLNAMLGAVYERFREIGIYSSVGLAPVHISLLFVAEAVVYAVLGVTLGYLLGQGLGKGLVALDVRGLNLNYSSMSAVVSALLVMGVVLLSTIYPARVAARMAVPDVLRRWKPPPPEGDSWRFPFPFNVSEAEVRGICGFLYDYFNSFSSGSVGDLHTAEVRVVREGETFAVKFKLWLPPFDLGVSEQVELTFSPTDTERIWAIHVDLARLSGELFYWQQLNQRFMNQLRKELLIWHTLDEESREEHRQTAIHLLEQPAEVEEEKLEREGQEIEEPGEEQSRSPFTWKGIAVGAVLSLLVGIGAPYGIIFLQGSYMALNSSSPGAIFLFFFFTLVVNTLLGGLRRRLALSRADLVLLYVMLLMAVTVPTQAFVGYLIPVISGLYYYASPENKWGELFAPHVPRWLTPQDQEAVRALHEGLAPGEAIPWSAWVEPLGYWYVFFLVLSFMMICMGVILHRQWSSNERLAYPMVELPLRMIDEGEGGFERVKPFFKSRGMWIGFGIAFLLLSLNGLHHYVPSVPTYPVYFPALRIFEGKVMLPLRVTFAWVGFFYLVNLDITFSIWVFYVLGKIQEGIFKGVGIASTEQLSLYSFSQTADLTHQAMGACLVFVLYSLWIGRKHLREVWRKAWDKNAEIDDSGELLSYRTAVFGFLGSLVFIGVWLWASGIPLIILPLFVGTCLIFYVFVTRVIATAGVATARSPMVAAFFVISGIGTSVIGAKGLVALTFTYIWQSEMRLFPMIACANGLKLAESVKGAKTRLFWAMGIALVCSLAGATWIILTICYDHGGINLHKFFMNHQAMRTFTDMARVVKQHPVAMDMRGWVFTGVGGAIEGFLMFAQHRFYWWPLHPVGFVISVGWLTGQIWFSVFVAWLLKSIIVKYGGARAFNVAKPLFLGLILGEATAAGFWLIVDWLTGEVGNMITNM